MDEYAGEFDSEPDGEGEEVNYSDYSDYDECINLIVGEFGQIAGKSKKMKKGRAKSKKNNQVKPKNRMFDAI
jgi:hypothetical protein